MEFLNFNSVELLPNAKASAAFMVDSGKVFREDTDIAPVVISESLSSVSADIYLPGMSVRVSDPIEQKGLQTPALTPPDFKSDGAKHYA
mgnify:CR=1 FL=1